ncbi:4-O-beta-D-mannosyl-D-glucose phosphorylase [subsurface metagenome]
MKIKTANIKVEKQAIHFSPDESRVVTRLFSPRNNKERIEGIIKRILSLPEKNINHILAQTIENFADRHLDIKRLFKDNFDLINANTNEAYSLLSLDKKLLIGSYFTKEYSIESAALFNPSIVSHPDQSNVKKGSLRVIISFRAVGEGHISSIVFRKGSIDEDGNLIIDTKSDLVEKGKNTSNTIFNKQDFILKLKEIKSFEIVKDIINNLLDQFTHKELVNSIKRFKHTIGDKITEFHITAIDSLLWLVDSTYEINFDTGSSLSGRIIFPVAKTKLRGLEDARFVLFKDNETSKYYATFTAFNGQLILPQLIETEDFIHFKISSFIGEGSENKGIALFPEKINGKYAVISRNDNENLFIMFSDNILYWENPKLLKTPTFYWELFQIGNCGSPIKTKKGWLLLTHGVGPVRTYCIGAVLLDLNNPSKVIGIIKEPILVPDEKERNGYVPNVAYSCGGIIHNNKLILPYAMSDSYSGIAKIDIDDILNEMQPIKPK